MAARLFHVLASNRPVETAHSNGLAHSTRLYFLEKRKECWESRFFIPFFIRRKRKMKKYFKAFDEYFSFSFSSNWRWKMSEQWKPCLFPRDAFKAIDKYFLFFFRVLGMKTEFRYDYHGYVKVIQKRLVSDFFAAGKSKKTQRGQEPGSRRPQSSFPF